MPISSYAPEYFELFRCAAQAEVHIPLADRRRASYLRYRLHKLRTELRAEHHPLTTIANSVQISITTSGDLRCYPADTDFLNAFKAAGITINDLPEIAEDDSSKALAQFFKKEKEPPK